MTKLTLKGCIDAAIKSGVVVHGDLKFRGKCKKEDDELIMFFDKVRYNHPEIAHLIFHPENEFNPQGDSSYGYYQRSKRKGRLDSVADIVCLPVSAGAPAFICELKRLNIAVSLASKDQKKHFNEQVSLLASQNGNGAVVCVALGCDNAYQAFEDYLRKYK